MRVLGLASDLRERRRILREAVDVLEGAGDHLELAYALTDLSRTHYALGESSHARLMIRRAHRLARQCQAEPLSRVLGTSVADPSPVPDRDTSAAPELATRLSEAERRVAMLAAEGNTNREIARKLFITTSTVEQHLTRVYRKLKITRRSDLPAAL
jgi:DNA-binding CsgD family transcriptional regulator